MSKRKLVLLIIIVWAIIVIGFVCYYGLSRKKVENNEEQRAAIVSDMVSDIKQNSEQTFVVNIDELPVEGDEEDELILDEPVAPSEEEPEETESDSGDNSSSGSYNLTSYGTISIPSIDLELPIWEGAGKIELRYGAGRMPTSASAGTEGNLVIFGHRMKKYGSMFNRLGEVQVGDNIDITTGNGSITYIVDEVIEISPSELSYYIGVSDGVRITLITCTPVGVGSHRLLVIGHAA